MKAVNSGHLLQLMAPWHAEQSRASPHTPHSTGGFSWRRGQPQWTHVPIYTGNNADNLQFSMFSSYVPSYRTINAMLLY